MVFLFAPVVLALFFALCMNLNEVNPWKDAKPTQDIEEEIVETSPVLVDAV